MNYTELPCYFRILCKNYRISSQIPHKKGKRGGKVSLSSEELECHGEDFCA